MINVMFVTKIDIAKAKKRLLSLHKFFKEGNEQEAVADFATCLGQLLVKGTPMDFVVTCEQAAKNMAIPGKLPETYDAYTVGVMQDLIPFFAEKIFGKDFSKEVVGFIESRELV